MRLIDADALIVDLEYDIAIDEDILNYVGTVGIERTTTQFDKDCKQNTIDLLMRQPSIDIVRCKECKHDAYVKGYDKVMCMKTGASMTKNDFCSYGERKDQ